MNFVAVDFETANEQRSSPCAIGIVVVRNGKCVERISRLIRPPECRFSPFNVSIHGISEKDVIGEPEFCDLWGEFLPLFEGNHIIAHNAAFDISVLRNTLAHYGIPFPSFAYTCTMAIAKRAWPDLVAYKLPIVAKHLGIEFDHHDALQDAIACSEIALRACQLHQVSLLEELATLLEITPGEVFCDGYRPPVRTRQTPARPRCTTRIAIPMASPTPANFDPANLFYGREVVFTGPLRALSRKTAKQFVANIGGTCASTVTLRTSFLIQGGADPSDTTIAHKSTKRKRAEEINAKGGQIQILSEADFLKTVRL